MMEWIDRIHLMEFYCQAYLDSAVKNWLSRNFLEYVLSSEKVTVPGVLRFLNAEFWPITR